MDRCFILAVLLSGLLSTGCVLIMPDRIHYKLDVDEYPPISQQACTEAAPSGDRMLGVALSGGGSRAAVFAAASLEALWEHGLLEQVTHVSSVSGGSMASSYLVANKPSCDHLTGEGGQEECWRAFFSDFQEAMRRDYITRVELRQLMPNRMLSPTRRALSMQEELDKRFLHERTFSDIQAGPASGDQPARPVLLINATSYDTARRFVFSNACLTDTVPDAASGRKNRSQVAAREALEHEGLRALSFSKYGCTRPVPGDFPVSLAVSTSAAFPPLMGPVNIQATHTCDSGEPQWWHLGDGGIIENSGIDTLEEMILRDRAAGGELDRVFLLTIDAGRKTDAKSRWALQTTDMWTNAAGVSTVVDAPRKAARDYHHLFWQGMRADLEHDGINFDSLLLEYTAASLDRWPESCGQRSTPPRREDIAAIGTALSISTCNADLLVMAAHQLVHDQMNGEAGRSLEKMGIPVRPVDE